MRLLFLSKRFPQGRDLISRPYGRFFHLPATLAARGHQVRLCLISHQGVPAESIQVAGLDIESTDIRTSPLQCLGGLAKGARRWSPDWVIGCSDAWIGVIAARISKRAGARLALDAYDDFESYMPWNLPLHYLWREALRRADLVTAAGPQLAHLLDSHRPGRARPAAVVPMAADPAFQPMDRQQARGQLGLSTSAPLLGYTGSWSNSRGSQLLLEGFSELKRKIPDAQLVLTGRPPSSAVDHPGVHSLGYVDDQLLPTVVNAMDACAVVTADTRFGRGSYPAKLCEAMACGVPVVATATEAVRWMLGSQDRFLAPLAEPAQFAEVAATALGAGRVEYKTPTWATAASSLERSLMA